MHLLNYQTTQIIEESEMAPKWNVLVATMAVLVFVAHRLTKEVLSEIGEDVLDEQIDEIVWVFYEDWKARKPVNFMSAMKDLGRLFDENDPNEMMLRLKKRLQVHRQNVEGTISFKAGTEHKEGLLDSRDVRSTRRR